MVITTFGLYLCILFATSTYSTVYVEMDTFNIPITPVEEYEVTIKEKFAAEHVFHEGIIFHQLTGKHVPSLSFQEKQRVYGASKQYQWDKENDTLYYKRKKDVQRRQVVRTFDELASILKLYHSSPTGGHSGWHATFEKVSRLYYWRSMVKDIQHYVSTCEKCQRHGLLKTQAPTMRPIKVKEPLELVGADLIGGGNLEESSRTRDESFVPRSTMSCARPTASRGASHQPTIPKPMD